MKIPNLLERPQIENSEGAKTNNYLKKKIQKIKIIENFSKSCYRHCFIFV